MGSRNDLFARCGFNYRVFLIFTGVLVPVGSPS